MKKLAFILLLPFFVNAQKSDSTKLFQKVSVGAVFATVASTTFSGPEAPFSIGHNLMANVCIVTPKTYHNILYGFGNNAIISLNGYFLPKNWDAYVVYSRTLNTGKDYLGAGIEKMIKVDNVRFFLFTELGTNFKGTNLLSFGLLVSLQNKIWKRK